jgi:hypothetical protein
MKIEEEFRLKPIERRSNLEALSTSKIRNARNKRIIAPDIRVDRLDEALEIQARYWGWYDDENVVISTPTTLIHTKKS